MPMRTTSTNRKHVSDLKSPDANPALRDLLASVQTINVLTRNANRDDLAAIEITLRDAADAIARELRVERCLIDDWADK